MRLGGTAVPAHVGMPCLLKHIPLPVTPSPPPLAVALLAGGCSQAGGAGLLLQILPPAGKDLFVDARVAWYYRSRQVPPMRTPHSPFYRTPSCCWSCTKPWGSRRQQLSCTCRRHWRWLRVSGRAVSTRASLHDQCCSLLRMRCQPCLPCLFFTPHRCMGCSKLQAARPPKRRCSGSWLAPKMHTRVQPTRTRCVRWQGSKLANGAHSASVWVAMAHKAGCLVLPSMNSPFVAGP